MRVIKLTQDLEQQYTAFVENNSNSMFYHTLQYRELLRGFMDCETDYLLCIDKNTSVRAVLPLFCKEGRYGKVYNSLPFYGSNGGILAENNEARLTIIQYYNQLVTDSISATIITSPLDNIPQPTDLKYDLQDYRIGQLTFFTENSHAEDLMTSFHYKTRNMIRKSQKNNIEVRIENTAKAIEYLYQTHIENMQEIGGQPKTKLFFDLFPIHFQQGKDYDIYLAYLNEEPIAAMLLFYHKKTVEYYTPVISHAYRELQPLSLLIFEAMQEAVSRGFSCWNWGGTWASQEGVYRFKQRWGTTDINYYYYTQLNNEDIFYASKEILLEDYKYFFVLPFQYLKTKA